MPLTRSNRLDYWRNDEPVCPHCDHVCVVSENEWWKLYEDNGDHEVECPSCGKEFTVEVHCSYKFSTEDQSEHECTAPSEGAGNGI